MDPRRTAAIAIGAATGAALRWAVTGAMGHGGADMALLLVNLTGAAVLALLTTMRPGSLNARTEALVAAGFCGAFTTWSSLALRTASRYHDGIWLGPTLWLLANLICGLGLVVAIRGFRNNGPTHRSVPGP